MPVTVESGISGPFYPNGVTTAFAFNFKADSTAEVLVVDENGDALSAALYSVALNSGEGGTATFAVAPLLADYPALFIVSSPAMTQESDFGNAGPSFNPTAVTRAFDRAAIRDLSLQAQIDRAIKVPFGDTGSSLPAERAGLFLSFDVNGNPVASSGTGNDPNFRADAASSGGAALLGVIQSGTGSVARTAEAKMRERLDLNDKMGPGLDKFNSAAADLVGGGILNLPRGTITLNAPFTFTGDGLNIEGSGDQATVIRFDPVSAATALTFNKATSGGSFYNSLTRMTFYSINSVDKTAIDMINTANCTIRHIAINSGGWLGDSIGVRTRGRQSLHFHSSAIACARPLVHSPNVTHPELAVDHYLDEHLELIGTSATRPCIEFENGVVASSVTMRHIAIVGGKDGILRYDTTSTGASYQVVIAEFRSEQGLDPTGYTINWESTAQTQQVVTITNGQCEPNRNGIRLRGCQTIEISNVQFAMGAGRSTVDIVMIPNGTLEIRNCTYQAGATPPNIVNGKKVFSSRIGPSLTQQGFVEKWVYDVGDQNMRNGANIANGMFSSDDYVVATGTSIPIAQNGFTGLVMIATSNGVFAEFVLTGSNNLTQESRDLSGQFSNTAATGLSTNIYWDVVTSRYRLENNTGSPRTYTLTFIGRAI